MTTLSEFRQCSSSVLYLSLSVTIMTSILLVIFWPLAYHGERVFLFRFVSENVNQSL